MKIIEVKSCQDCPMLKRKTQEDVFDGYVCSANPEIYLDFNTVYNMPASYIDERCPLKDSDYGTIEGVLMEIHFSLLRDFVNESKKHEGVVISDVPELKKKFDDVEEFLKYTEKFFGHRYNETKYCFERIQK